MGILQIIVPPYLNNGINYKFALDHVLKSI